MSLCRIFVCLILDEAYIRRVYDSNDGHELLEMKIIQLDIALIHFPCSRTDIIISTPTEHCGYYPILVRARAIFSHRYYFSSYRLGIN